MSNCQSPTKQQQRSRASRPSVRQAHAATRGTLPTMCDGGRKDSRTDGITRDSDRIFNTPFTRPRLAVCRAAVTIQIEAALTGHQITKRPCPAIPVAFQSFECTGRRHLVEFVITIVKVRFKYSLALKKSCVL
jgi:hypothetical protein